MFCNESYNGEQGIEPSPFDLTEPISFLAFSTVRCYITVFYNNKYIIISSLTNGVTDIGVFLSKAVRKDYKAQERNYTESVSLISST